MVAPEAVWRAKRLRSCVKSGSRWFEEWRRGIPPAPIGRPFRVGCRGCARMLATAPRI